MEFHEKIVQTQTDLNSQKFNQITGQSIGGSNE